MSKPRLDAGVLPDPDSVCCRRDFLKAAIALPLALRLPLPASLKLQIAIVAMGPRADEVVQGARMSITEAQRAAQLLGATVSTAQSIEEAHAIILAADASSANARITALLQRGVPVLNSIADPAALTSAAPQLFHVTPPACTTWSAELDAFGGSQLNARYRAAYQSAMRPDAWAGWMAAKIIWESASRIGSSDPHQLTDFLTSTRAVFDGHRGKLLSFDPETHILNVPCL